MTSPATTVVDLDDEGIPDFTPPPGPKFRVYDHVYEGVREISADGILEVMAKLDNLEGTTPAQQVEVIKDIVSMLLVAESSATFIANMSGRSDPIGIPTLMTSINWLVSKYTARPTEPDSDSSPGFESPESGTSSTATTSAEESTSSDFRLIDSST